MLSDSNPDSASEQQQNDRPVDSAAPPLRRKRRIITLGSITEIAEWLLGTIGDPAADDFGALRDLIFAEGSLWRCGPDHIWHRFDETDVYALVKRFDGAEYMTPEGKTRAVQMSPALASRVSQAIAHDRAAPDFFAHAAPGVAFSDVFMGASGPEPLTSEHRCRARFPFAFDPTAPCPQFERLLRDSLTPADRSAEELAAKAKCMLEYVGRSMLGRGSDEQAAIMCIGGGNNGKSQLFDVFEGVMPTGTTCSVDPVDMASEQHRAMLVGARLNVVREIPEREILKTGQFKKIVAGENVSVKVVYQKPFRAQVRAGHLFASNSLPQTDDPSRGFWRRWLVIPFEREVPVGERIENFGALILATERQGIASRCAALGAASLATGAKRTVPSSSEKAKTAWRHDSDQIHAFARECLQPVTLHEAGKPRSGWTKLKDVYDAYLAWNEESGSGKLGRLNFRKGLPARGFATHDGELGWEVGCRLADEAKKAVEARRTPTRFSGSGRA